MFPPAFFRWAGTALVVLGMTACVCSLSAQDTVRIKRWIAALLNKNPDVREAAALALQKQGAKARAALPALKIALKDKEASVRAAVSRALLEIDEALTHEDLLRRLNDRKLPADQRQKVCRQLARNNWDDAATVTALEEVLSDSGVCDLASGAIKYILARRGVGPALVRTIPKGGGVVAFSPDGNLLATCTSRDGVDYIHSTVRLWDALTGKEVASFKGHKTPVTSVAFSPDGKALASGSWDSTIKLWDVATGRLLATLRQHDKGNEAEVSSVAFSPDGKTLASASARTVKLWDVASRKARTAVIGEDRSPLGANRVAFSPDGKSLFAATDRREYASILWDVTTGKTLATLRGHTKSIESVCFSPSGKTLASASGWNDDRGEVILWDVTTGKALATLKSHPAGVYGVAFSPDGKILASAGGVYGYGSTPGQGEIKLWDARTGQELASVRQDSLIASVAFSPDGKILASVESERSVRGDDRRVRTTRLWAVEVVLASARKKSE
jgi:WD40 repeat protein